MAPLPSLSAARSGCDEVEITSAAILAHGRLVRAIGRRLRAHATPDGGLICEDRANGCRPTLWRVLPDGAVVPDHPYSFVTGAFLAAVTPQLDRPALAA